MVPVVVWVVSMLQFLLAVTFLVVPTVGGLYGRDAQRAAEADVVRQGFPAEVLAQQRINFAASRASILAAVSIGLCLATLASLNLAASGAGQTLSWIFQSLVLVGGGLIIMPGEVFTVRYVESAFRKSGDPAVRGIDVKAFVDAGKGAFPAWCHHVIVARFALATVGSLLVIILLALPSANAYFH